MFKDRSRKPGENSAEFLKPGEHGSEVSSGADEVARNRQVVVGKGVNNIRKALHPHEGEPNERDSREVETSTTRSELDLKRKLGDEARRRISEIPQDLREIGRDPEQNPSTDNPETRATKEHVARISNIVEERYNK